MNRLFQHELVKLFLFIIVSFIGAALLSPHLYSWGKDFAAAHGPFLEDPVFMNSPKVWLAEKCDSAKFSRYFNRSLYAVALVIIYPLIRSLRKNGETEAKKPFLRRIKPKKRDIKDLCVGILLSTSLLTLLIIILHQVGWIAWDDSLNISKAIKKAIAPAILASLIEEWIFRGVLYDVVKRKLSATNTIIGLSLFFAALHFLKPPEGAAVADPRHALAGFEMLGLIGQKFLTASSFFGVFLTLFVVGATLAYTRHKTGKLWMAIGLHAGWVFSLKFTNKASNPTGEAPPLFYNDNITDGLLPLFILVSTFVCVALYLKPKKAKCPSSSPDC